MAGNYSRILGAALWVIVGVALPAVSAYADDLSGTVSFEGLVVFPTPIPGVAPEDLDVSVKLMTEATGPGEKCSILSITSDNPDPNGAYPDSGAVTAEILMERGGQGKVPQGECIVTVQAAGDDGVSVSGRGTRTVFVAATEVGASGTVAVPDIIVRQSKAVAGVDRDCLRWLNRQLRKRARCNIILLKRGALVAQRCKDGGEEPPSCDPGDHAEVILALTHGVNDQQTDPNSGEAVDISLLRQQFVCQKKFARAGINFARRLAKEIQRDCIEDNLDSEACREQASKDVKRKLDIIDRCDGVDQDVDGATGRPLPDLGEPCDVCIDELGAIDRKCIKNCFQIAISDLVDGIVGNLPVCGNGISQPGEFCDDGNQTDGDCCSSGCIAEYLGDQSCGVGACEVTVPVCQYGEPVTCVPGTPGIEGPSNPGSCSDTIDNDCDALTDLDDPNCQ